MSAEVNIPDEALKRAFDAAQADDAIASGASRGAGAYQLMPDIVDVALRAAAPLIVAAERQKFAAELDRLQAELFASFVDEYPGYSYHSPTLTKIQDLRRRASELRGETSHG